MGVESFYGGWQLSNTRLIEAVRPLSPAQLQHRIGQHWPVWAIVGHMAGARAYWLCDVLKESGAETTPFTDASGDGWEDHEESPRTAEELVWALDSTWKIVERCLARWTPEMLDEEFRRQRGEEMQFHARQNVIIRLMTHDAYHIGEVSQIFGANGLPEVDIFRGLMRRAIPAPTHP